MIEINEAFSVQVLVVRRLLQENHGDDILDRLNVNGGAIALGHPIGTSGARILTTLIHAMDDRGSKKALLHCALAVAEQLQLLPKKFK